MGMAGKVYAAAWGLGGIIWIVTGLTVLGAADGTREFYVMASAYIPTHLLVLVGLVGLLREGVVGEPSWGRAGLYLAMVARVVFIAAEVTLLARGYEGDLVLLPIAAASMAVGMLVAGVAAVRAQRWQGWARFAPLAMGVYPFVFMFPILAATGARPDLGVALWGLTFVGIAAAFALQPARRSFGVPSTAG